MQAGSAIRRGRWWSAVSVLLCVICPMALPVGRTRMLAQATPPGGAPSFTAAQASAGASTYQRQCASCHGAQLEGLHLAPSLVGERFDRAWRGQTVDRLMFHVHRMPPTVGAAARGLSDGDAANVVAHLLQANGLRPGVIAMPSASEALAKLTIPRRDDQRDADPDAPTLDASRRSATTSRITPVTDDLLRHPPAADWPQWGRTYDGHNFSPLAMVTRANVSRLKLAWRAPLRGGTSMPTPVVHDGIVFLQTIPDTVLALDGSTGDVLWRHRHTPAGQASRKMGLSLTGHRVLVPTSDLHVLALDARTGGVLWNHAIALEPGQVRERLQLRSAPLIVGNKAIIGVTASMAPRGGFIVGLDVDSGKELWRFHTIARPGEPNGSSWNGLPLDRRSGGSVWHQGTYDRELNLVYFGVAPTYDTGPLLHRMNEAGVTNDALYTNCTLALNPDTGKLVWFYQHAANDQWDLDWVFERQIAELEIGGRRRKVVMNVGKMAILEALDAATGEYLFSVDAKTQNVITRIDPKTGAKTIDPEKLPNPNRPTVVCPSVSGARAWPPTSYNARTGLLYLPLTEWCNRLSPEGFKLMTSGVGISSAEHPDASDGTMGRLQAIDVMSRTLAWAHHQSAPLSTSLLATAGGVVFSGDLDPSLKAFDDATGTVLWRAELDDLPSSSLVTYAIGHTQYVGVVIGLRNNHVNDLSRTYAAFRKRRGERPSTPPPAGGAAMWVFSLMP